MSNRTIVTKVAGVTHDGRQDTIALMTGHEPCRIQPEPTNPYDANALAVWAATADGLKHVGYVPRDLAAQVAPYLDGEQIMVTIFEITGGFGDFPIYGLRIRIELPDEEITIYRDQ